MVVHGFLPGNSRRLTVPVSHKCTDLFILKPLYNPFHVNDFETPNCPDNAKASSALLPPTLTL